MPYDAQAELGELNRLASKATQASEETPRWALLLFVPAEIVLIGAILLTHGRLSTWATVTWWAALIALATSMRLSRRVRARHSWATPAGRRNALRWFGQGLAINVLLVALWPANHLAVIGILAALLIALGAYQVTRVRRHS
jgi:hypothetical protein